MTDVPAPPVDNVVAVIPPPPPDEEPASSHPNPTPLLDAPTSDTYEPEAPETKTLADLAREVTKWTLHADHDLHSYLKRYSADLFARTKDLEDRVRDIAAETDSAHVRLKNTFNEFLLLSNNQFIENRVYDEEQEDFFGNETGPSSTEKPELEYEKDDEMGEAVVSTDPKENGAKSAAESIVSKYRSALDMGMEAMKLFVLMNDEDDASETSSPFDTVLDIYNERPLPFIIGTREFLEDETLGLGAAPEEDSESASESDSDLSYSSSDSNSISEDDVDEEDEDRRANARSRSRSDESDGSAIVALPRQRAGSDESDTSGLFGRVPPTEPSRRRADSDESSSNGLFGRPSVPQPSTSMQRPVYDEDDSDDSDWSSNSDNDGKSAKHKASFASQREAPPPFAASLPARKQFLDSSDEESDAGLFGSTSTNKARVFATDEIKRPPTTSGDRSGDSRRSNKPLSTRRSDSSDSSSSDNGELFGSRKETNKATAHAPPQGFRLPSMDTTKSRQSNILEAKSYDSSDSDAESTTSALFGRPASATKETRKPAAVSILPPAHQSRRLDFSDDSSDDEEDGLFGQSPAKPTTPKPISKTVVLSQRPPLSDSSSDDEDRGLFGAKPIASATTLPQTKTPPRAQPVHRAPQRDLFGEDDSDDSDTSGHGGLFASSTSAPSATLPSVRTKPSPVGTHDDSDRDSDSDSDDGLFGQAQPSRPAAVPIPRASMTPTSTHMPQSRAESDSSDSDDSGLFGAPPARAAPTLMSKPAATTSTPPPRPMMNARQSLSEDDSDDWSDDDGGLFGTAASQSTTAKPALSNPTPVQAAPSSDSLFGPPKSTTPPVGHPPMLSTPARMQVAASDSSSDSDSDWEGDGGLFGPPKSK